MDAVVDYVDSGHDLIFAASASASDLIRNIATECGVDFDDVGLQCFLIYASVCFFLECVLLYCFVCVMVQDPLAMVIDHNDHVVSETQGDHTLIASDDFIQSDVILGNTKIEVSFILMLFR